MAARQQVTTQTNALGKTTLTTVPAHRVTITPEMVSNPATLSQQMNRMAKVIADATKPARTQPRNRAQTIAGVKFTSGSPTAPILHGYGVPVRYIIVRWQGAAMYGYTEATNDVNRLVLNALVTGVADLEIWPVQ